MHEIPPRLVSLRTPLLFDRTFTMMALGTGLCRWLDLQRDRGKSAAKKRAEASGSRKDKAKGAVRSIPIWRPANYGRFERGDTAGGLLADLLSGKVDADSVIKGELAVQVPATGRLDGDQSRTESRGLLGLPGKPAGSLRISLSVKKGQTL